MLSDLKRCGRVLARVATDCDCRYTRNHFCSLADPYRRQFPNHCLIFGDSPSDLRAVTFCVASWIFVLAVDLSPCSYCGLIFGSLCCHVSHCRRYGSRGEQGTFDARSYRHSIATRGRRDEVHDSSELLRPHAGVWTSSDELCLDSYPPDFDPCYRRFARALPEPPSALQEWYHPSGPPPTGDREKAQRSANGSPTISARVSAK